MPKFIIGIVVMCALAMAQEAPQALRTTIGIFNLDILGGDEAFSVQAHQAVSACLTDIGAYEIYTQEAMEKNHASLKLRFPRRCQDPRCAAAVGTTLNLDRMLYGSIDKTDKTVAVLLTMVDVGARAVIGSVTLEGDAGVSLTEVMKAAINQLHGREEASVSARTRRYYGPEVHNERELLISAPVCVGAGLLVSLANGSLTGRDKNSTIVDYDYSAFEADREALYGVGTGSDLIPIFGRPCALANAYVAASDDAYGVFFNPAGLAWVAGAEASLGYQYLFGLNNVAASYVNKATREIGFGQGVLYTGDHLMSELYFVSSISYKFNELVSFLRPFSVGASVKVLTKWTGKQLSESAVSGSDFGLGLDLGLKWELSERIHYGLLFKNVPAFGYWHNTTTDTSYGEAVPPNLYMGGTFQANYATFLICEGRIPLNEDQPWVFAGGIERDLFAGFRVRIGIEKRAEFDTPWKFTAGFGARMDFAGHYMIIDGSYQYNTLNVFAHPVNISLRFGF